MKVGRLFQKSFIFTYLPPEQYLLLLLSYLSFSQPSPLFFRYEELKVSLDLKGLSGKAEKVTQSLN